MASNLVRSHSAGTKIRVIAFNQFELSHATTATGSKTVLTVANGEPPSALGTGLIAIDPTKPVQSYQDVEQTTGYYFARYKHSVDAVFGSYNDALVYDGWAKNTVGYMVNQSLRDVRTELSDNLTKDDCYAWINEGMEEIKNKQLRWPEHSDENYVLGQTSRGINTFTLPTDIYDNESDRSITGVRIGDGVNLTYLDPALFETNLSGVSTTQVRTEGAIGAITLEIDNSYDFADSGTFNVYISGTAYSITYTGVTRSATAGVLTGVPASGDGSITATIAVDTNIWQGESEGSPLYYTVRDGVLEIYPLPDSSYDNKNVYLDYDKIATEVNSEGDEIDFQRYGMVQSYLSWRMWCKAKNDGVLDLASGWHSKYKEKLNDTIRTLQSGKKTRWRPNINQSHQRDTKSFISSADRRGTN